MNDVEKKMIGKTIAKAEIDGHGIHITFADGSVFDYDASDGGYSQYELTDNGRGEQKENKMELDRRRRH